MFSRTAVYASSSRPVFRSDTPELERGSGSGMFSKKKSVAPVQKASKPRMRAASRPVFSSTSPPLPESASPVMFPPQQQMQMSAGPPVYFSSPPVATAAAPPLVLPPQQPPQLLQPAPAPAAAPDTSGILDGLNLEYLIDPVTLALGRELGEGFFGVVHAGMWQGQPVAVKRLKQHVRKGELENFRAEVNVLGKLRHPNITAFYGVTQPPNAMIVTELLHGSLNNLIYSPASARLSTRVWLRIMQDVAAGVGYLHGRNPPVIHRDLSSANVLVTGDVDELERDVDNLRRPLAKVSDFGLSRTVEWYMTSCVGNLFYLAPEVFKGEHYTEKVDVYSFAIMLVEVFGREPPMKDMTGQRAAYQCAVLNYRPPIPEATPEHVRPLVMSCWAPDPAHRPSFVEIIKHLRHESCAANIALPLSPSKVDRKIATNEPDTEPLTWLRAAKVLMNHLANRPPLWKLVDQGIVKVENAEYWFMGRKGPVPIEVIPDPPRLYHQVSDETLREGPAALGPDSLAYDSMPASAFEASNEANTDYEFQDTYSLDSEDFNSNVKAAWGNTSKNYNYDDTYSFDDSEDFSNNATAPEAVAPEESPSPTHRTRKSRGLSDASLKDTYLEEQTWQEMSEPVLDDFEGPTTKSRIKAPTTNTKAKSKTNTRTKAPITKAPTTKSRQQPGFDPMLKYEKVLNR